ncbi:MAG: ABC transporter ATP-binding protein [Gammaproteobacteria bacterium]|nr:ABC transporter ATP-binding protein [Gammaproteobacteria bacterium]
MNTSFAINVKDLHKRFGSINAVNGVSLQVKKGEIFGFLGPNGGGKTTTFRMICGLLTPDSGSGTCLGYDIITQAREIKSQIGYMTQKFSLYEELSIYENFEFIARMYNLGDREKKIQEALEFFGLPNTQKDRLAGTLSGGWKQRLSLAAAVLHQPKLLLLDEPTAGVDPKARREFWDEIHRLSQKGITTLVSTHYMDEAARCHRLAYISKGQVLTHGTIDQIIEESQLKTWQVQGPDLDELADKLRKEEFIDQVTNFGQSIHVGTTKIESIKHILKKYDHPPYTWTQVTPTIEDIFIKFTPQTYGD